MSATTTPDKNTAEEDLRFQGKNKHLDKLLVMPSQPAVVAYVCGTVGCLIGADIPNLGHADESGAQMESIGGAGTFDETFLTGIMAVVLAALI
jgi:uncharacterized membrane protein